MLFFTAESLGHAVAGASGAVVAITAFFPLDAIRTRQQAAAGRQSAEERQLSTGTWDALRRVVREEGWTSLYRGLGAVQTTMGISYFVYFFAYEGLKQAVSRTASGAMASGPGLSPLANVAVAWAAGSANVLLTTPMWVVNTRMKVQGRTLGPRVRPEPKRGATGARPGVPAKAAEEDVAKTRPYRNILDGLLRILREEGPRALWAGTLPSLVLVCNPSIQFLVYEQLKWILLASARRTGRTTLGAFEIFLAGALAKTAATLLTYPLQVAQTRLRSAEGGRPPRAAPRAPARGGGAPGGGAKEDRGRARSSDAAASARRRRGGTAGGPEDRGAASGGAATETGAAARRRGGACSTLGVLREIYARRGWRGLFAGMEAKLWQTVLTAAFMFVTYEKLVALIFRLFGIRRFTAAR
jgi:adenine nucleotide transporter 17